MLPIGIEEPCEGFIMALAHEISLAHSRVRKRHVEGRQRRRNRNQNRQRTNNSSQPGECHGESFSYETLRDFTRFQMRRWMLGKSNQTLMPQKCEPSVQMGVVIPARKWQGGPI